jgi:hypothetical protein
MTLDIIDNSTNIDLNLIKVSVNSETPQILSGLQRNYDIPNRQGIGSSSIIKNDIIATNEAKNYKVRIWIDYDAGNEVMNKTFEAKLSVIGTAVATNIIP